MSIEEPKKTKGLQILDEGAPVPIQGLAQAASAALLKNKSREEILSTVTTPFDDYSGIDLTPDEAAKLQRHIKKAALGSTSFTPMMCAGARCPFADRCPLVQMGRSEENPHGKAPVNLQCILEVTALADWLSSYIQEYQVDPNSFTEINMCNELAEIEVMLWRINLNLSKPEYASLVVEQTIGVTPRGEEITQQQVSPLLHAKQQLNNRKTRLIKLMVGDRQEKYKRESALKQKQEADPSTKQAATKAKLEKLQRELDQQAIDAEILTPEDLIAQTTTRKEDGSKSKE